MRGFSAWCVLVALGPAAAGGAEPTDEKTSEVAVDIRTDFANGAEGWLGGFSDYSLGSADQHRSWGIRPLPADLGIDAAGFYIQGTNTSDDLFMFLTRRLTVRDGIQPNGRYMLQVRIELASNAPSGAMGVGGAPGESVYVKAGASPIQPTPMIDDQGRVTLNIDKGDQSEGGAAAGVAGNVANGRSSAEAPKYVLLKRAYRHPKLVSADGKGNLWLIVGTDSGFEGRTALYYRSIAVTLRRR